MENAPFGVNREENAIFEKVCKTASFCAGIPEMEPPEGQTGALKGPDWRVGDDVSA
jgi:hypothetical protein